MSISLRILLGFGFGMLLMILLGAYALEEIDEVRDVTTTVVARDMTAYRQVGAAHDAQEALSTLRLIVANRFLSRQAGPGAGGDLDAAIGEWQRQAAASDAALATVRQTVSGFIGVTKSLERRVGWVAVDATLQQADDRLRRLRRDSETEFGAMRTGDVAAVQAADAAASGDRLAFDQLMNQAEALLDHGVRVGQDRVQMVYQNSVLSVLLALGAALAFAVTATLLIRRSITRPLGAFIVAMDSVGSGDLSARAEEGGASETARLGITLNRMVAGLRTIAKQSRDATENLNVSVAEIRTQSQEQAASVEQQLAAVQETAATVDEIAHSGTQITRRAQDVIVSAQATALTSAGGLHAVQEIGRAMEQIQLQGEAVATNIVSLSEKTEAIGEIVSSVNDISERTHLLALNAAIEAAAAGEHGRSFAVVAAEMKILAEQAKEATQQVRSILGDIGRGINMSVMLTEEAVKRGAAGRERTEVAEATIDEMAAGIQDAVETFQQIVASTNQQQLGIEQVMTALQNIRQASAQTAAGTRQLDAAALGLGTLSRQLLSVAERFRF